MPTISFLFFSGPYQSESPETTIELAKAALQKGVNVKIFCYMDAVNCVKVGQKKVPGVTNIEEQFRELIARGAECPFMHSVHACKRYACGRGKSLHRRR